MINGFSWPANIIASPFNFGYQHQYKIIYKIFKVYNFTKQSKREVDFSILLSFMPGGFTLHMTGYAHVYTKSVEKGSFLDIRRRRHLLQTGYIFAANRTLGVLKWVKLLAV